MKKILVKIVCCLSIIFLAQNVIGQKDYSTIQILSKSVFSKVYLNDRLITSFNRDEALEYKLTSKGRITKSLVNTFRAEGA